MKTNFLKPRDKQQVQTIEPVQPEIEQSLFHQPGKLPRMHQQVTVPRFNRVYDSMRSDNTLLDFADFEASGTVLTVAGALAISSNITLPAGAFLPVRLEQWPGAVQAYLSVTYFGVASQSSAPTTIGNLECYFIDVAGIKTPLANLMSNGAAMDTGEVIIRTPLVDPNPPSLGNVGVQLNPGGATVVTVNFDIRFSFVYLLPSEYAHDLVEVPDYEGTYRP